MKHHTDLEKFVISIYFTSTSRGNVFSFFFFLSTDKGKEVPVFLFVSGREKTCKIQESSDMQILKSYIFVALSGNKLWRQNTKHPNHCRNEDTSQRRNLTLKIFGSTSNLSDKTN